MPPRNVRVALIQTQCDQDREQNLATAVSMLEQAADSQAEIACLPELFLGNYFCQSEDSAQFDRAEAIPGPTTHVLSELAQRRQLIVLASLFERRVPGLYFNSLCVIGRDGKLLSTYRKMHIPDDPLYYEKYYFTPGDQGFQSVSTEVAQLGPLVCWDQWYPEAARLTALKGAEILFYPTAIGWHPSERDEFGQAQREAWQTIQRSHAIANGVFVVAVNRIGHEGPSEGGLEFWGHSFVADPFGRILAQAEDRRELILVDCDLSLIESTRRQWPFFRDRRVDAYAGLDQRWLGTRPDLQA